MIDSASMPAPPKSRRNRLLALLALLGAGLPLLWSGLWFYGASQIGQRLDAWIAQQHQLGSDWTCPQRSITGFPWQIELACDQPSLASLSGPSEMTGRLQSLHVLAQITSPDRVEIVAQSPLVLDIADQEQRITLAWESLTLTIGGLMHGTTQADLVVTQPRIAVLASAQAEQTGSAAAFTLHVQPNPQRPASEHVIDARMTLASLLAPALDGLEGSKASAEIAAALTLSQTVFADDMTWPQQLERWRQGGGRVDVTSASLTKGGFKLDGSGHVMLDDLHRVEGRINAQATGLAPILARLGVPVAALNVGNLLNGLLKLGKGQPSPATDPGAMPLPLKFEAGEIFFGPLKMPVTLRPLY